MSKRRRSRPSPAKAASGFDIRRTTQHLAIVVVVGVVIRLFYDLSLPDSILLGNYTADSLALHTWATMIAAGETPSDAFFRAPLYPYLVAGLYKVFAVSPWPVILFQNLLGLFTGIISYFFARELFGVRIALPAALVVVLYPTLIFFEAETMMTTLAVCLYTSAAYRLMLAVRDPSTANLSLAGITFGLAAITRPTILPLALLFPALILVREGLGDYRRLASRTGLFALALMIPILPATIANVVKGGELVLISTQGGANFYIGNNSEADGITVTALGPLNRVDAYQDNIWTSSVDEAERRTGTKMTQSEVSSFWYRQALGQMAADPLRAVRLLATKFYLFWHGQEIYNNRPLYFAGDYSWLMRRLVWRKVINFPSGILFPLTFLGMALALRGRNNAMEPVLIALGLAVVVATFFVCARFRQPVIPIAAILGVYAVQELVGKWRHHRKAFYTSLLTVVLLLAGLNAGGNVDSTRNLSQFHAGIGVACVNKRHITKGITHLQQSLAINPRNISAIDALGQAYLYMGRLGEAEAVLKQGLLHYPDHPQFHYYLGIIYQKRSDIQTARDRYVAALQLSPGNVPVLLQLAELYERQGRLDSALLFLEEVDAVKPGLVPVRAKIDSLRQAVSSSP